MADIGTLIMKIKADSSNFDKGMSSVKSAVGGAAKTVAVAGLAMAGTLTAVGAKSISMGADAEEMLNKYNVVFDGMTDTVDAWAEDYANAVGRSKFDIQESVSNLADLQQGLGMTKQESFDLSKQIVELGTDLASFNNVNDATAIEAISKAMLGEAESAKQLGLLLNVDRVKEYAEAQGYVWENVTDSEKAQLTYNLAVEQSQNAIGDAKRSSESFTNQVKALKAGLSDATTEMGMQLIPIATKVVQKLNTDVVPALSGMMDKAIELGTSLADKLSPHFEAFGEFITNNMPTIKSVASNVFEGIVEVGRTVWTFISTELLPIFQNMFDWWQENKETLGQMASDAFNVIETAASGLWDFFTTYLLPIIESVANFIMDNYPAMRDTAQEIFDDVVRAVQPFIDIINDYLIPAMKDVLTTAEQEFPAFLEVVETTFGVVATVIEGVGDAIYAVIGAMEKLEEMTDINIFPDSPKEWIMPDYLFPGAQSPTEFYNGGQDSGEYTPDYVDETPSYIDEYIKYKKSKQDSLNETDSNSVTYNLNITGNSIMSDRDITKFGDTLVSTLKVGGVFA